MKDFLLITPPFTQLNTPYPATAYIKGFFNTKGISAYQADLGIDVTLKLFSSGTFAELFDYAYDNDLLQDANSQRIYALRVDYLKTIDHVIYFLQGKAPTLARQICSENFLPRAARFEQIEDLEYAFGYMGLQDQAKHIATLYLEDLSDFIKHCIDENFGFSRYAERLGRSANQFDELHGELQKTPTFIDNITLNILDNYITENQPTIIGFSIPFPGNLYSAFRCAQHIKDNYPHIVTTMGGGFPNTELRSVTDTRVFDYFDYITLDDGELPLELLHKNITQQPEFKLYKRTLFVADDQVVYKNDAIQRDYKMSEVGTPDYDDLRLNDYISVIEITNPMHSLWSDGRWNKLTMAHGCYWGKCTFCDVSLDYIKVYDPVHAKLLVDRMETLIEQTGETGFHFVDEAAPPALMRELALEILRRDLTVSWWTNIRFEKRFTKDLCLLLKASGCIAVSGGLEVASDRLLKLIDKGVTVEQVARVTRNFTESNIMVHAYLMYGYPTQTEQETIDSLEMVRQLFELQILQSGFWHQFALTAHSPIGLDPETYGVVPKLEKITFANNDVAFKDKTGIDHDKFSYGLKKSLLNYMHNIGFEAKLQSWFNFKIPKTTVSRNYIKRCLDTELPKAPKTNTKIVWLGNMPLINEFEEDEIIFLEMIFHNKANSFEVIMEAELAEWLLNQLEKMSIHQERPMTFGEFKTAFEEDFLEFDTFWYSDEINTLKETGLLTL